MCGVCGCSGEGVKIEGGKHTHADGEHNHHHHDDHHHDDHHHRHERSSQSENATLQAGVQGALPMGAKEPRLVAIERALLERNDHHAAHNRAHFSAHRLLVLNLVSSPGSGKTTLLAATLQGLRDTPVAVIEGDQQTSLDAERIRAAGAPAVQINTGKGCHLEAEHVGKAFQQLHHLENGFLFIENVGNLVCPASFDLGETHRVVIASVTEGEDKPLKYPDMFASADLLIVSKADIAQACGADVALLIANARKVRPGLPAIVLSARSGEGMDRWMTWLKAAHTMIATTG